MKQPIEYRAHDGSSVMKTVEKTDQGWNYVLPGCTRSAQQAAKARGEKMRGKVAQKPPAGMFEASEPKTPDLFE
jgi:hypothetical protein